MLFLRNSFFIFLILFSCTTSKEISTANSEAKIAGAGAINDSSEVIASIERTECRGYCPVYKAVIYKNGKVEYFGEKNVSKLGIYKAQMDEETITNLIQFVFDINYFDFERSYDGDIADLPSTITYVSWDGFMNGVKNNFMAPEELEDFEQYFDLLLSELIWIKAEE